MEPYVNVAEFHIVINPIDISRSFAQWPGNFFDVTAIPLF